METPTENTFDSQDDLRASNEVMKLKLELDHKMIIGDSSGLSPETESLWLNHIYNFEKLHKECGRAKVYDLIGRPAFAKYDSLTENQLHRELTGIRTLLAEKSIVLDCCCEYDDVVIYRFITEELFEHEMDAFFMEGMVQHFIYEEFHPNHDYDLRRYATRFIESILSRKWDEQFDHYMLSEIVSFQDKKYPNAKISSIVLAFQEAHTLLVVEEIKIETVNADVVGESGIVQAQLAYIAHPREGKSRLFKGKCTFQFVFEHGDWNINGFELPGFAA